MKPAAVFILCSMIAFCACSKPAETPAGGVSKQTVTPDNPTQAVPKASSAVPTAKSDNGISLFTSDGFTVTNDGKSSVAKFGMAQADTLKMLLPILGEPKEPVAMQECGVATASYSNGLMLSFEKDKFAGWTLNSKSSPTLMTKSNLHIGSTRADVSAVSSQANFMTTTLGAEFTVLDLAGIFDGDGDSAKISNLWAGRTCNYR